MKPNVARWSRLLATVCGVLCAGIALESPSLARAQVAPQQEPSSNGLYTVSSAASAREVRTTSGRLIRVGERADLTIHRAHVYALNNANEEFEVRLDTSNYRADTKAMAEGGPIALRVGSRWYEYHGGGGTTDGRRDCIWYLIHGREEAEAAANSLSAECTLRSPPGYKLYAQFIPSKSAYSNGEPVSARFELKNLDEQVVVFQKGGQQRGARDNQYGFRAILYGARAKGGIKPVLDVGDPVNFGGLGTQITLRPGEVFKENVDLKKWFAFDAPGRYSIHGFYALTFYRPLAGEDAFMPWADIWSDYAAADFAVEVK